MASGRDSPSERQISGDNHRSGVRAAAGLALLILVTLSYYVFHKPVGPQLAANVLGLLIDLLVACLIALLSTAIGSQVLQRWRAPGIVPMAAATVIGMGIVAAALLVLGFLGLLRSSIIIVVSLGMVVVLKTQILDSARRAISSLSIVKPARPSEWSLAVIAAILAVVSLLEAAGPPVRFDALVYHLTLPREFVRTGSLLTGVENPFWGQPLMAELIFTWARLLSGRASAMAVSGWLVAVLTVLSTHRFAQRLLGGSGWISVAALMAGLTAWSSPGWGYVDWWAALAGAAAIPVILMLYEKPDGKTARMAGLLCGLAIATKLTAGVLLLSALAVLLVLHRSRVAMLAGIQMLGAAALAYSPWLIKNAIAVGQPLYPFLGSPSRISPYQQSLFRTGGDVGLWDIVLAPVRATLVGVEGAPGFATSIGPLMLGLTAAMFLAWRSTDHRVRWLVGTLLAWWLLWGAAAALRPLLIQTRLYFAMFPAWAVGAAAGYRSLSEVRLSQVRIRSLADAIILTVFTLSALQAVTQTSGNLTAARILGTVSDEEYLVRRLGAAYPAMQGSRDLGDRPASVLMLWEPRSYYCVPVCIPDPWIGRWYSDIRQFGEVEEILRAWRQRGIEYVVTHDAGVRFVQAEDRRYTARDWEALAELQSRLDLIDTFGSAYSIYRMP